MVKLLNNFMKLCMYEQSVACTKILWLFFLVIMGVTLSLEVGAITGLSGKITIDSPFSPSWFSWKRFLIDFKKGLHAGMIRNSGRYTKILEHTVTSSQFTLTTNDKKKKGFQIKGQLFRVKGQTLNIHHIISTPSHLHLGEIWAF